MDEDLRMTEHLGVIFKDGSSGVDMQLGGCI